MDTVSRTWAKQCAEERLLCCEHDAFDALPSRPSMTLSRHACPMQACTLLLMDVDMRVNTGTT